MKKLSTYLFLILFSFSAPSFADDISDFQIEGMSVGDSLLDYFSEKEINDNRIKIYNDNTFLPSEFKNFPFFKIYDVLQINYKSNNKKFIIHSISGIIYYKNDIKNCERKKNEIVDELSELFKNEKITDEGNRIHPSDEKSVITNVILDLGEKDGHFSDNVTVSCFDLSVESGFIDQLRIGIKTLEYDKWLFEKAYK